MLRASEITMKYFFPFLSFYLQPFITTGLKKNETDDIYDNEMRGLIGH